MYTSHIHVLIVVIPIVSLLNLTSREIPANHRPFSRSRILREESPRGQSSRMQGFLFMSTWGYICNMCWVFKLVEVCFVTGRIPFFSEALRVELVVVRLPALEFVRMLGASAQLMVILLLVMLPCEYTYRAQSIRLIILVICLPDYKVL